MFVDTTTARLLCYARGSLTSPQLARATRLCSHLAVRTSAPPPTVPDLARLAHKETPSLPVLLSLAGSSVFRDITRSPYRQSLFVFTAIETLRKEGLAGLDLAWEVPRGTEDRGKLSSLLKELREAFDAEGAATGRGRLLLTAAVPATLTAGFDVLAVSSHVDMLTVDAFDLHGGWEQQAAHHSPLFPLFGADSVQRRLTTEYVVKEWLSRGTPPQKLLVGLPTFGRSFTLANTSLTDVGAPAEGGGLPGRSTGEKGLLAFSEVCDMLKSGATLVWDNEQMVPYTFLGAQWVGFDDARSLGLKVKWLREAGLGGAAVFALELGDPEGACVGRPFPLVEAVHAGLAGYLVPGVEVTLAPVVVTVPPNEVTCDEADGHISYVPDRADCTKYYMCEGKRRHHMPCPSNLVFNPAESVCDWPDNVAECSKT